VVASESKDNHEEKRVCPATGNEQFKARGVFRCGGCRKWAKGAAPDSGSEEPCPWNIPFAGEYHECLADSIVQIKAEHIKRLQAHPLKLEHNHATGMVTQVSTQAHGECRMKTHKFELNMIEVTTVVTKSNRTVVTVVTNGYGG